MKENTAEIFGGLIKELLKNYPHLSFGQLLDMIFESGSLKTKNICKTKDEEWLVAMYVLLADKIIEQKLKQNKEDK